MGIQTPALSLLRLFEKAAPCLLAKGAPSHCTLELSAPTQPCWEVAAAPQRQASWDTCGLKAGGARRAEGAGTGWSPGPSPQSPQSHKPEHWGAPKGGGVRAGLDISIYKAP